MRRRIILSLGIVGIGAGLGDVTATFAQVAAQSQSAGQRVARTASQVPSDWIAAHPDGGCMTNPFTPGCGAPGHPIRTAYYPPEAQLAQQLNPRTSGKAQPPVSLPSGASIAVTVATAPSAVPAGGPPKARVRKSATRIATCTLFLYAPARAKDGSNVYMYSQAQASNCSLNTLEVTACTDLLQRTTFKARGCDTSLTYPKFALASAWYDCGHSNVITYTNRGTGYIEDDDGNAGFNSASKSANHSCT